MKRITNLAVMG